MKELHLSARGPECYIATWHCIALPSPCVTWDKEWGRQEFDFCFVLTTFVVDILAYAKSSSSTITMKHLATERFDMLLPKTRVLGNMLIGRDYDLWKESGFDGRWENNPRDASTYATVVGGNHGEDILSRFVLNGRTQMCLRSGCLQQEVYFVRGD